MLLKSIIRDYLDTISGKAKTRELMAPYVADESLYQHVEVVEKGFPLYRIKAEDMIEEQDKVVVRARFAGTHTGEFNGIPATGKTVDLPFMIIYRLDGGKIVEHWLEINHLALLTQLGVMSSAAEPA